MLSKKLIPAIYIIFITIFVYAGGDMGVDYGWENIKQIKGNVKECTINFNEDDFNSFKAYFDDKGKLIKFETDSGIQEFSYNSFGITEIKNGYLDENNKMAYYSSTKYVYDSKGKLINIVPADADGNEFINDNIVSYDKNGNIIVDRYSEGILANTDIYNKNMYLIESDNYDLETAGKKIINRRTMIKYDKDFNMIEKIIENTNKSDENMPPKIVQTFQYKFDKNGNKIFQKTSVVPSGDKLMMFYYLLLPDINYVYDSITDKKTNTNNTNILKENMKVSVEWNGVWYPAVILKMDEGRYLIHYIDYDSSWDEWVTKERIKF
jgi:hypothetical protein